MKYLCLDTETTGLEDPIGVTEVAWIEIIEEEGDYTLANPFSTLIKSPYPISCGASGVSGIRDEDLEGAPTLEEIEWPEGEVCLIAHKVDFDRPLVEPYLNIKEELCTLLLSRRLLPGIDDYKLQTLGCACHLSRGVAHRASLDVQLVGELLVYMLDGAGWKLDKMLDFYKRPFVHRYMPFGKHKGELMTDVPTPYLTWLYKQDLDADMRATLNYYMQRR